MFALHPQFKNLNSDTPNKSVKPMERFVAMPSESMWAQGYKPGWMLSDTIDPPEKYCDALKMYRKYLETGKVIYPKKSKKGNSTTATASIYMNKYSRSKNKKANKVR